LLPTDPRSDVEAAAWLVAESAMRLRTGGATQVFDLWRRGATGEVQLDDSERARVRPFVQTVVGSRANPAPADHVEGYVAELVWYLLTRDSVTPERQVRKIEEPSFYVTGPGGDGLVVFELTDGTLVFRLWEIKKHTGSGHLSATTGRAMRQLAASGAAYLAQYVSVAPSDDPAVEAFYAHLVDYWVDSHPLAGAGVAVGTSAARAPKRRCFSGMQTYFPGLTGDSQLEGLIASISDFTRFAEDVRGFLWTSL
jgi:hypothetical protein